MDTWSLVDGHWKLGDLPGAEARWFDLLAPAASELHDLAARLHLHPLAVEDCLSTLIHPPKVDEFPDYLFIVLLAFLPGGAGPEPEELDVFLGRDFLITYQDRRIPAVEETVRAMGEGIAMRPGIDGLLHAIADRMVDDVLPQVHGLGESLDALQDDIIEEGGASTSDVNHRILKLRASAGQMRRLLTPQLSVINRLSRGEFGLVAAANHIYFRDIYDHLVRIDLALEGLREDAEVALSTYLSALNNRMNEVMKVLSVVGAIALPAVVIAGIFGTNFDNVPGLHSNWGFALMLASMGGLAVAMGWYFKRKDWW